MCFLIDLTDREKETVSSPSRIIFSVTDPTAQNTGLLKGIPTEPIQQFIDQHVLFGRGHSVGVFLNDETVSREHMKLFVQTNLDTGANDFVVETVSNTKPVYINGRPLLKQGGITALKSNDKLGIGMLEFTLQVVPGDSVELYQLEFVTSGIRHQYLQQANNLMSCVPPRGAINSEPIIMVNQLGAVIVPNNFGMPVGNPTFNMNISTSGGRSSQFGPMMAPQQQHPFQQQPTVCGMPAATSYPQIPSHIGMGHHFVQQEATHNKFQYTPFYSQQPESAHFVIQSPLLHQQIPAQERRQMYQTTSKHPSEHSEDSKENGHCKTPHPPVQETDPSKAHV